MKYRELSVANAGPFQDRDSAITKLTRELTGQALLEVDGLYRSSHLIRHDSVTVLAKIN